MSKYQAAKTTVRNYFDELENATPETVTDVLKEFTSEEYLWRGVYPFREQHGAEGVAATFWEPLMRSLSRMQRRQDIFIGGTNEISGEQWVMSMGNFMGLFDADWLGIRHTRKMAKLRYAEFNCVVDGKITQTGLFIDIIGLMVQAGSYPLPPSTGVYFNYPG
ncbi:MAG: nuclear transport factor 2 family protein, partial [bacterium]|nr:nuclear transport factor 2 family protein [bacterium]